ncbi:MAG: hypothetical protein JW938_02265 [Candidatus Omnitrophica bacterium]|nr:hypothetical protein [Candidatus Omnitrophota bacterium]
MPLDFSEFNEFDLEKIKEWERMEIDEQAIERWKEKGVLVEKLYEFKMKKLYLEYLKVKLQNEIAAVDQFIDYDPVKEAEKILRGTIEGM